MHSARNKTIGYFKPIKTLSLLYNYAIIRFVICHLIRIQDYVSKSPWPEKEYNSFRGKIVLYFCAISVSKTNLLWFLYFWDNSPQIVSNSLRFHYEIRVKLYNKHRYMLLTVKKTQINKKSKGMAHLKYDS